MPEHEHGFVVEHSHDKGGQYECLTFRPNGQGLSYRRQHRLENITPMVEFIRANKRPADKVEDILLSVFPENAAEILKHIDELAKYEMLKAAGLLGKHGEFHQEENFDDPD